MVNNDYDQFTSFSRLHMTLFRHRTCTYLHGRAARFLVLVSSGQVAAFGDWACYRRASIRPTFGEEELGEVRRLLEQGPGGDGRAERGHVLGARHGHAATGTP